jgi:hypothetical protein
MTVIAIDPGPSESAFVLWSGEKILDFNIYPNGKLLELLHLWRTGAHIPTLAVEMIGHYGTGMAVGKEVFNTCIWIGRFIQVFGEERTHLLLRATIKAHTCGNAKAKDANVRQALIDKFGGKAAIKKGGPLYKVSSHCWSALAVAITFAEHRDSFE